MWLFGSPVFDGVAVVVPVIEWMSCVAFFEDVCCELVVREVVVEGDDCVFGESVCGVSLLLERLVCGLFVEWRSVFDFHWCLYLCLFKEPVDDSVSVVFCCFFRPL